jgi:hypothetical protein
MSFWDWRFVREGSHSCIQDRRDTVFVYFLAASILLLYIFPYEAFSVCSYSLIGYLQT